MGKIDFHVQVTPPEVLKDLKAIKKTDPYFARRCAGQKNAFAHAPDVLRELDRAAFDRAVIFGFGFNDMGLCRLVNDYVIEQTAAHPARFTGFCVVPPNDRQAEQEIIRCHDAGLRGVGELFPEGQNMEIENEKKTRRWTSVCVELGLPVLIHAGEPLGRARSGKADAGLQKLGAFTENTPRLTIVFTHWGGGLCFYEIMKDVPVKCANVYYDTAASPFLYKSSIYHFACALGLQNKILFGSGYPLVPLSRAIQEIEECGLSDTEKAALYGGNAAKILNGSASSF